MSDTLKADTPAQEIEPLVQDDEEVVVTSLPPMRRASRRWDPWLIALVILLVLLLVGGGLFFSIRRADRGQVQYTTQAAAQGNLTLTVSATGPVAANATYNLDFGVQGQVSEIAVHVGQTVKKGQTLAKVSSPALQDAVNQAQQAVTNAQTTYNDDVYYGASQSAIDAANGQLQSAQLQLKTAQDNLAAATLTAPGNGTVAAINGQVGQTTGSSASATSPFITLIDTSSFSISALVNEADIGSVQSGQSANFSVSAYPTRTFRAAVNAISMVSQTSQSVVSYPVTLTVDAQSLRGAALFPGMTATATIVTAQHTGVLLISNAALSFPNTAVQAGVIDSNTLINDRRGGNGGSGFPRNGSGGQGNGQRQGFGNGQGQGFGGGQASSRRIVLELRNGVLTPVVITVGLTNGVYTEVLSGLQAGDQVVVSATGGNFANLSNSTNSNRAPGSLFPRGGGGGGGAGGRNGG